MTSANQAALISQRGLVHSLAQRDSGSWFARRRLMAVLRMSCRVLGMKSPRGLGLLGVAGAVAVVSVATPAAAQNGIYINANADGNCTTISDSQHTYSVGGTFLRYAEENITFNNTTAGCNSTDKASQTNRVLFYRPSGVNGTGATSMSLGGELYVNGPAVFGGAVRVNGSTVLGGAVQVDGSAVFGGAVQVNSGFIGVGLSAPVGSDGRANSDEFAFGVAIGNTGTRAPTQGVAIGQAAKAETQRAVAIGWNARAEAGPAALRASIAIGENASAADVGIAMGLGATQTMRYGIAIGRQTRSTEDSAIAIGANANASNIATLAIGLNANAGGSSGTAVGTAANAAGGGAFAGGQNARALSQGAVALGLDALVNQANTRSLALGAGAVAEHNFSVALGSDSRTGAPVGIPSVALAGTSYTFAGAAPVGVVSVGSLAQQRQIINVGAGRISADSTDATNGSQLFAAFSEIGKTARNHTALQTQVDALAAQMATAQGGGNGSGTAEAVVAAIGPGASVSEADGSLVLPAIDLASAGAVDRNGEPKPQPTTILGAIDSLDDELVRQDRMVGVLFENALLRDPANAEQFDAQSSKIANVAAGTAPTDAVNFGQLEAVGDEALTAAQAAQTAADAAQTAAAGAQTTANAAQTAAEGAQTTANAAQTAAAMAQTTADGADGKASAAQTAAASAQAAADGAQGTADAAQAAAAVAQTTADGADGKADAALAALGGGAAVTADGVVTPPSYDVAAIGADGTVGPAGTHNTVGDALDAIGGNVVNLAGVTAAQGEAIAALNQNALLWDDATGAFTAARDGAPQRITNVTAGTAPTDAVNVSQLESVGSEALTAAQGAQAAAEGAQGTANAAQTAAAAAQTAAEGAQGTANAAQAAAATAQTAAEGAQGTANGAQAAAATAQTAAEGAQGTANAAQAAAAAAQTAAEGAQGTANAAQATAATAQTAAEGAQGTANAAQAAAATAQATANSADGKAAAALAGLGGGAGVAADGTAIAPSYNVATIGEDGSVAPAGTMHNNVGDALDAIGGNVVNLAGVTAAQGEAIAALNQNALLWDDATGAFTAARDGAPQRITNVAAGTAATDAVNVSQLESMGSEALTAAQVAQTAAEGAQGTANAAQTAAATAQTAAEGAQGTANAAQTAAATAQTAAEGAQGTANAAQAAAATATAQLAGIGPDETVAERIAEAARTVGASAANALGGGAEVNPDGSITQPAYAVAAIGADGAVQAPTQHNNVGDALAAVNGNVAAVNSRLDDALLWDEEAGAFSAGHGAVATNRIVNLAAGVAATDAVNVSQLEAVEQTVADLEAGRTGLVKIAPDGRLTIGADSDAQVVDLSGRTPQTDANGAPVLDADGNPVLVPTQRVVTGVADGVAGNDATNKGQLDALAASVAGAIGGGAVVGSDGNVTPPALSVAAIGPDGAVRSPTVHNTISGALAALGDNVGAVNTRLDDLAANAISYDTAADGSKANSLSLQGGDPNAPVLISNVAKGTHALDAVNVEQLNERQANTVAQANSHADRVGADAVASANNYTNLAVSQMSSDVGALTNEVRSGFGQLASDISAVSIEAKQAAAIGLAASSLRFNDTPGKLSIAAGGGFWGGQGALALGVGYTSEDGDVRLNLTGVTSGGNIGVGGGFSVTLN